VKLKHVDPRAIEVPAIRVTAQFEDEQLKQFQESIKAVGQIAPIIVYEVGEKLVLCDGWHRLEEAKKEGRTLIDAIVIPGDEVDVLTKNIFLDHLRGKTPVSQMVRAIGALYQDYGLDVDKIKEKTGLTRDYIEKLIRISTASPEVSEALDQGAIGVGVAYELSRLPLPLQQEEVLAKSTVYRLTAKTVKELVDAVLEQMSILDKQAPLPPPTEPPTPRKYYCEGCKGEVEPRYLRPVMVCPNCFGDVWRLGKAREAKD
jgi:ParB-like chromosome segregation protein Spo0J